MPHNSAINPPWRFAEFFAGMGLMRLGLERACPGWKCVFANDLDPNKRELYHGHFGQADSHFSDADVHSLSASDVPDVCLATASFPCTDLSLAGGRGGIRSGESSAFWGFHRVLRDMGDRRPALVLLENVVGFLSSHQGADFRDAMQAMNELGYAVDPFIVDARWFVPQSRQRLFVVCHPMEQIGLEETFELQESALRPAKLLDFIASHRDSIHWRLRDLPLPSPTRKRLRNIIHDPPAGDSQWWSDDRTEYLYNQMFPRHQAWVDEHRTSDNDHYATAFRRVRAQPDGTRKSMAELRTDGFAGCLRTPKGGSAKQILVRVGRGQFNVRLLNAVECAALMGAADFQLNGSLQQALFGFGDAVCVDVIEWIAKTYLEPTLARHTRDWGFQPQS